ncbi:branched-chain amino acid transport system substrate-binding protein [Allocatelliglobosispora scoriae]|uniref:Branched-chain amino acid transport system substrate-binding protein n=1 Tax=Allocatelliglobosispora scoriae TaxID=643052 RepID=A0A841BU22_9ACTN|nr:ABC transporter substrate-binding protein [Allocatelliglobosispora scoriae]MBB5870936.1 branched-chain amino acid transport system substrate-binding protein [Allocatelliglobosispora scoriae]
MSAGQAGAAFGQHDGRFDRRRALQLFGGAGLAGALAACSSTASDNPYSDLPVSIGLLLPQTGSRKAVGDELKNGFELWLEQHSGLLGGHPAQITYADEGDTTEKAKAAADDLLRRNVLAISGVAGDNAILEMRDSIEKAHIPLIGSGSSPTALRLQTLLYMWHTSYVGTEPGKALGIYMHTLGGGVSMVAANNVAGRDSVAGFIEGWGGGSGAKLADPYYLNSVEGIDQVVNKIANSGNELVFCGLTGQMAIEFVRAMRKRVKETRFYAPGSMTEGPSLEAFGSLGKGIFTASNYSPQLSNAANLAFSSSYRAKHSTAPTAFAVAAWDAAAVLDKAIKACRDKVTADEVNLKVGGVGLVTSPRGTFQFNQTRTPQQKWYLREVRNDGPVLVNALITELATLG